MLLKCSIHAAISPLQYCVLVGAKTVACMLDARSLEASDHNERFLLLSLRTQNFEPSLRGSVSKNQADLSVRSPH